METRKQIADRYSGQGCTLNGEPAKITGRLNSRATVASLTTATSVEFSWAAVARIMADGGNFKA